MRRFRATWLRKQRAPEDIIKFWLGHTKESMTDKFQLAGMANFSCKCRDNSEPDSTFKHFETYGTQNQRKTIGGRVS
jgi:hypothetical protein